MRYSSIFCSRFKGTVRTFYRSHKRTFPWRTTHNPYRILVSEIMLQQTQTERVIDYYLRFLKLFPTFESLAKASLGEVLTAWQGLGYNRRARALRDTAIVIVRDFDGQLPQDVETLRALPGIGPYTAAAVLAFAFNKPTTFIETNIRTVYLHHFFPRRKTVSDKELLSIIECTIPKREVRNWYYALMDYGAFLKKQYPKINHRSSHYRPQSKFKGSRREARGRILALLGDSRRTKRSLLIAQSKLSSTVVVEALSALIDEGFLRERAGWISIVE